MLTIFDLFYDQPANYRYAILCGDTDVRVIDNPNLSYVVVQMYAKFLTKTFNAPTKIFVVKTEV